MVAFGCVLYKFWLYNDFRIVEFIRLKDALVEMETLKNGFVPKFDLIATTYSDQRGTGGDLLVLKNISLSGIKGDKKTFDVPAEFQRETISTTLMKNPRHRENKTKNILMANREIRKVHIRFILFYNNKQILQ